MAIAISELIAVTGMCPFSAPALFSSNSCGSSLRRAASAGSPDAALTSTITGFGLTENGTGSSPAARRISSVTIESLPPPTADSGRPSELSTGRGGRAHAGHLDHEIKHVGQVVAVRVLGQPVGVNRR